jgi:hypothetical protein
MPMLETQQLTVKAGAEGRTVAEQFYALASSSPVGQENPTPKRLHTNICDTAQLFTIMHLLRSRLRGSASRTRTGSPSPGPRLSGAGTPPCRVGALARHKEAVPYGVPPAACQP